MKTYIYKSEAMKKVVFQIFLFISISAGVYAQKDSLSKKNHIDTAALIMNQDAGYKRPFIVLGNTNTAVGGYLE